MIYSRYSNIVLIYTTKTRVFKYIENLTTKNENFQMKNSDSFTISASNINCGYLLEPPWLGGCSKYTQSMLIFFLFFFFFEQK